MSDLVPGGGKRLSRRTREQRAYRLVLLGGGAGAVAVIGGVLALFTSFSWTIPVLAAIVAAVCIVLFRSVTSRR